MRMMRPSRGHPGLRDILRMPTTSRLCTFFMLLHLRQIVCEIPAVAMRQFGPDLSSSILSPSSESEGSEGSRD